MLAAPSNLLHLKSRQTALTHVTFEHVRTNEKKVRRNTSEKHATPLIHCAHSLELDPSTPAQSLQSEQVALLFGSDSRAAHIRNNVPILLVVFGHGRSEAFQVAVKAVQKILHRLEVHARH